MHQSQWLDITAWISGPVGVNNHDSLIHSQKGLLNLKWLFDVDIRMITLFCNLMIDFIQTYHPVGCPQNHRVPGVLGISVSK